MNTISGCLILRMRLWDIAVLIIFQVVTLVVLLAALIHVEYVMAQLVMKIHIILALGIAASTVRRAYFFLKEQVLIAPFISPPS